MKLLKYSLFFLPVFLCVFNATTLKAAGYFSLQQVPVKADTSRNKQSSPIQSKVQYAANGRAYSDVKTGIVYLYDNAKISTEGLELQADYIRYDSKNETIFASGVMRDGRYVGRPIFKSEKDGSGSVDSLFFDNRIKSGMMWGIYTAQQGGFFSGGRAKVQPDNEVHIKGQVFSTCDLPHPHYGIYITKGIIAENQIMTGPFYLQIEDIPMPIGFILGFFPKPNRRSSGLIFPSPNQDATRGFSLNGGGYYFAFNDHIDARLTSNIYTNGSFDLNLTSQYIKRYKYNGNLSLSFASMRNGLEGTPEYKPQRSFHVNWSHSQNVNARPGTTFSASVNAGTSNYFTTTYAEGTYDINAIAQNTLSSSVLYGKVFGNGRFNFSASLNHSQETQAKTISLTLPQISLNMSSFNPFDSKNRVGKQKWYQKISVGYSMSGSNTVRTTEDLLFDKNGLKRFSNGFSHNIPISMAFNLLNYFNFNASANYSEKWYFQTIRQRYFMEDNSIAKDTVSGFRRAGEYNIGMGLTTKIYGGREFKHLGGLKAIRHIITPSVSFVYKPDFSSARYGYYKEARYYVNDIRPGHSTMIDDQPILDYRGKPLKYSIFDGSPFGGPSMGQQANLNFSVDNNVEIKVRSRKDTVGRNDKKIPIIQGLSFSGSYNFMSETKKLSPIGFNGRSQISDKIGFNFGGMLNPYLVGMVQNPGYGNSAPTYSLGVTDKYVFSEKKLPRLTDFNFSFDYSFNPEAFKSRNKKMDALNEQATAQGKTPEMVQQLQAISRDPNAFVDFNIPWNFRFNYMFHYSNELSQKSSRQITNTLNFNGDFSLTPKWKIAFNSGWDFKAKDFSFTSFTIYRDLHCWSMNASWVPIGQYQSYSITIQVKEAILQDLKLSKRKGYYTKY